MVDPLTLRSDVTSPSNNHTLSNKQVIRIHKLIKLSCYLDLTPNSCSYFTRKCVAARGEN